LSHPTCHPQDLPPQSITNHPNDELIALKKLAAEDGLWTTRKEILGWIFDSMACTITLPPEKIVSLQKDIHSLTRRKQVQVRELQRIQGCLIHATYGIPNGKGLISPIVSMTAKYAHSPRARITLDTTTKQALLDWRHLLKVATKEPTLCTDLIPSQPNYIGYCDMSKMGAGSVWFGAQKNLPPIVWRMAFPQDIQDRLVSHDNPHGSLSNSDFEMAGLLLHWLVLENLTNLQHAHVATGCDNSPTVAWAHCLISSKDAIAAHLLRALALCMMVHQVSLWHPSILPVKPITWWMWHCRHSCHTPPITTFSPTSLPYFPSHRMFCGISSAYTTAALGKSAQPCKPPRHHWHGGCKQPTKAPLLVPMAPIPPAQCQSALSRCT